MVGPGTRLGTGSGVLSNGNTSDPFELSEVPSGLPEAGVSCPHATANAANTVARGMRRNLRGWIAHSFRCLGSRQRPCRGTIPYTTKILVGITESLWMTARST